VCLGESCGHDGRAVSADSGADRHEESMRALALIVPTRQDVFLFPYPKVAAEPTMYWPKVLIMPLGPGPKRMMLVAPKMKPMTRPTAREIVRMRVITVSLSYGKHTATHHATHLHCRAVSFHAPYTTSTQAYSCRRWTGHQHHRLELLQREAS
jgi:hypothetical protein